MSIFTNFKDSVGEFLLNEAQAELSKVTVFKLYDKLNVLDFGIIIENVKNGEASVSLVKQAVYNAIPFTDGMDCSTNTCDVPVDYLAKVWKLVMADCRYTLCVKNAEREFMALFGQYKAVSNESPEYDFLLDQMSDILSDILANTLVAKIFLSDESLTETTINGTNGLLAQWRLEEDNIVTADADDMTGEEIYFFLISLKEKYEDLPIRETIGQAQFIMDVSDARKLVNFMNATDKKSIYDCSCLDPDGLSRGDRFGLKGLRVGDIPVKTIPYREMASSFNELVKDNELIEPIFAVLTPRTEVQVGVPTASELAVMDVNYSVETKSYYFDVGYQFDPMVPSDNFVLGKLKVE